MTGYRPVDACVLHDMLTMRHYVTQEVLPGPNILVMERGGAENEELADDILMRSCALRVFRASAIIIQKTTLPTDDYQRERRSVSERLGTTPTDSGS